MVIRDILLPAVGALLLLVGLPASSAVSDSDWKSLGKAEGGRTQDLVMSGSALLVSSGSKLYRSDDDGANWALLYETTLGYEQFPYGAEYFFNLLTPDPSNPNRIFTYNPDGLFRSLDGGESWQTVQHDFSYDFFAELDGIMGTEIVKLTAIAVSTDGSLIYVGDNTGRIYVSNDGDTWSPTARQPVADDDPLPVQALVADPIHPTRVYVGASGIQGENLLYRSDDGGETWVGLGGSYLESCNEFAIDTIAIDPTDGDHILAGGGRSCRMIHRSDNGGMTWTRTSELVEYSQLADIVFDPSDSRTVYAVFGNGYSNAKVLLSTDEGGTWQLLPSGGLGTRLHVSHSNPDVVVLSAGEDGVWRSTDGGNQWTGSNEGLLNKSVDAFVRVPTDSDQLVAVAGGDIVGSSDGGESWNLQAENIGVPYTLAMAINPDNASEIYIGANGIYKSIDGGKSWSYDMLVSGEYVETPAVGNILINPADPSNVVLADGELGAIFVTQDSGDNWSSYAIFTDENGGAGWICRVSMAPNRPSTLHATVEGHLYKSDDGGRTWQKNARDFFDACDVETDPGDANTVYVSDSTGVLRTKDGGESWEQVLQTQSSMQTDIAIDPNNGDRLLVADGARILASHDGGNNWTELSVRGLPENQIDYDSIRLTIMFDPVARERYYVTNYGGFVYEGPLPGESADDNGDTGDDDVDNSTGGGGAATALMLLVALAPRRRQAVPISNSCTSSTPGKTK